MPGYARNAGRAIARDGDTEDYMLEEVTTMALNRCESAAGIVIKAGASALSKLGTTALYCLVRGTLVTKAASTDNAAYAGTVLTATFNVFVHSINAAGTLATDMGTAGATLALVTFPTVADTSTIYGFTIINPTGTGSFVGGTTALDDATVVPTAVYISVRGCFRPVTVTPLLG